jgi:hypothetical protein
MLKGYIEDSVRSSPDLTEVLYDSVHTQYDDIDSLGQLYQRDTVMVKKTFHNDRTWRQAESIGRYLTGQGVPAGNISYFGNAIPATAAENKKLTLQVMVRNKK